MKFTTYLCKTRARIREDLNEKDAAKSPLLVSVKVKATCGRAAAVPSIETTLNKQ
jgi:hypothetical protein